MADEQSTTLHAVPVPANTFNPIAATAMPVGAPVAPSTGTDSEVVAARANSATTTYCSGLCSRPIPALTRGFVQFAGPITLATTEWDAVTGQSGGLTRGVPYYVSAAAAGKLTTTAPVSGGSFAAPVGYALSETSMQIVLSFPVGPHG